MERKPPALFIGGVWWGGVCWGGEMVDIKGEIIIISSEFEIEWMEPTVSFCRVVKVNTRYDSAKALLAEYRKSYPGCRVEWLTQPVVRPLSVAESNLANGAKGLFDDLPSDN